MRRFSGGRAAMTLRMRVHGGAEGMRPVVCLESIARWCARRHKGRCNVDRACPYGSGLGCVLRMCMLSDVYAQRCRTMSRWVCWPSGHPWPHRRSPGAVRRRGRLFGVSWTEARTKGPPRKGRRVVMISRGVTAHGGERGQHNDLITT